MPAPDMLAWLISQQNKREETQTLLEEDAAKGIDPNTKLETNKEAPRHVPPDLLQPNKPSGLPAFQSNRVRPRRLN